MRQRHLPWLLAIALALLFIRFLIPARDELPETVNAVERPTAARTLDQPTLGTAPQDVSPKALPEEFRPMTPDFSASAPPGNAFAVRTQAMPDVPPSPVPVAEQVVATPPPQMRPPTVPTAPQPPPIQVIGTWDDGVAPGVFVSTPGGAKLARKGTVLLMDFVVTAVTPQQLTLQHIGTRQTFHLNVPRAPGK